MPGANIAPSGTFFSESDWVEPHRHCYPHPGFFLTNQNRALLTNPDGSLTERGADVIRQTPFKRFGRPEELCGTIQYLISDASSFVTGTVAVVDGGFNAFAM